MPRLFARLLVTLLLAALLAPVVEAFDHWDADTGITSDTEFHVAVLATAVGLIAAVLLRGVGRVALRFAQAWPLRTVVTALSLPRPCCTAPSGASPPLIPLRI
jgi:hypothetical protein